MDGADTITVSEAAELLDVSRKTITNYAVAGRFEGAYKERDRWRIPLSEVERVREELQQDHREKPGKKQKKDTGSTELVDELRDRLRFVEGQLEAERQAHRESRQIIFGLTQRIPEMEAPTTAGAAEPDVSPAPTDTPTRTATAPHKPVQGPMRGLLRRFFGG